MKKFLFMASMVALSVAHAYASESSPEMERSLVGPSSELAETQQALKDALSENARLGELNQHQKKTLGLFAEQLKKSQQALLVATNAMNESGISEKHARLQSTELQLKQTQDALVELQKQHAGMTSIAKHLHNRMATTNERNEGLCNQIEDLATQKKDLEAQLVDKEHFNQEMQALSAELEEKNKETKAKLKQANIRINALLKEVADLKKEVSNLKRQKQKNAVTLEFYEEKLAACQAKVVPDLEKEQKLSQKIEGLSKKLEVSKVTEEEKARQLEQLQQDVGKLLNVLQDQAGNNMLLKYQLASLLYNSFPVTGAKGEQYFLTLPQLHQAAQELAQDKDAMIRCGFMPKE